MNDHWMIAVYSISGLVFWWGNEAMTLLLCLLTSLCVNEVQEVFTSALHFGSLFLPNFFCYICLLCVCMVCTHTSMYTGARPRVSKSENLQELILSFHLVNHRDWTQVIGLRSKNLYLLTHLAGPGTFHREPLECSWWWGHFPTCDCPCWAWVCDLDRCFSFCFCASHCQCHPCSCTCRRADGEAC